MPTDDKAESWSDAEALLRNWLAAAEDARNGHRLTGKRRRGQHTFYAVVLLVISGVTTTSSLLALIEDSPAGKWFLAAAAVITTVLGAIQVFAKYDQLAAHHEGGRAGYATVCRLIAQVLALPRSQRGDIKLVLDEVRLKLDDLAKMNVPIPENLWIQGVNERKQADASRIKQSVALRQSH